MPSPFLEIVELDDGRVALRRSDDDGEPLLVIEFSDDARDFLQGQYLEVAQAMITAGMQVAGQVIEDDDSIPEERVLH
jgi:hypothetical protein